MTQCEANESKLISNKPLAANSGYFVNEELGGPTEESRKVTEQQTETTTNMHQDDSYVLYI